MSNARGHIATDWTHLPKDEQERAARKINPCPDCPGTLKTWCCANEVATP